jgi:hypothetical protein
MPISITAVRLLPCLRTVAAAEGGGYGASSAAGVLWYVGGGLDLGPVQRHVLHAAGLDETRCLETHVVHLVHELDGELVVPVQTEQLVLIVALVEEDDVHGDAADLVDGLHLGDDARRVVTLILQAKVEHARLELLDLRLGRPEAELQVDGVG